MTDQGIGTNDQSFQGLPFNKYSWSSNYMPGISLGSVQSDMMLILHGRRERVKQALSKNK